MFLHWPQKYLIKHLKLQKVHNNNNIKLSQKKTQYSGNQNIIFQHPVHIKIRINKLHLRR
jgi:hypothetical protein